MNSSHVVCTRTGERLQVKNAWDTFAGLGEAGYYAVCSRGSDVPRFAVRAINRRDAARYAQRYASGRPLRVRAL